MDSDETGKLHDNAEQEAIINKIHNMKWLQNNSSSYMKTLLNKSEIEINENESEVNEAAKRSIDVLDTILVSKSPQLGNPDSLTNIHVEENASSVSEDAPAVLNTVGLLEKEMETIWHKDLDEANTLFSNSQSMVIQRLDEEEMMSIAIADSIVAAQLEQLSIDEEKKTEQDASHNSDNERGTIHHNLPDSKKSDNDVVDQVNAKQCQDDNNNNAKSKSETMLDVKKGVVKARPKNNFKKTYDHKGRKLAGNTLKETSTIWKQGSKIKEDFVTSSDQNKISSPTTDLQKSSAVVTPKLKSKFSISDGYSNRNSFGEKGANAKYTRDDHDKTPRVISNDTKGYESLSANTVPPSNLQTSDRSKPLMAPLSRYSKSSVKTELEPPSHEISESAEKEKKLGRPRISNPYKPIINSSTSIGIMEKNRKTDKGYTQKCKRESVSRYSSDYTDFKNLNPKTKGDDQKKTTENNLTREFRLNRASTVEENNRPVLESKRTNVNPMKPVAAVRIKTDRSMIPCSNSTKVITNSISTPAYVQKEPEKSSYNETDVQSTIKTEQETISNYISNNKTSSNYTEQTRSVKFSENVEEILPDHSLLYLGDPTQQIITPTNPFYSDLQNVSHSNNVQQMESHQSIQNKGYYQNVAQYTNTPPLNLQNADHDLQMFESIQQKIDQMHEPPQNVLQNPVNQLIAQGNEMHYQSISGMYLNQYNNLENVPRKASDCGPQNTLIQNTQFNQENQGIVQTDPCNTLTHNNQTAVLPPPGFHNHNATTQQNLFPEVLYYGNNTQSMNMQIQNTRSLCGNDFNSIQQSGYMQHPLFYMQPVCMQSWNPLMQFPAPLYQNQYTNCNTFPNQTGAMTSNNLAESINSASTSSNQNNAYKHYHHMLQLDNNSVNFVSQQKLEDYMGNTHVSRNNNEGLKDMEMRNSHYRVQGPHDYQSCSPDAQLLHTSFSPYQGTQDSISRNQSNVHMQMNPKYHSARASSTIGYQRLHDTASNFQSSHDSARKDDVSLNDSDYMPPMVSPKDCMNLEGNYSRKIENTQNSSGRSEIKSGGYVHAVNSQYCVPQFHNNARYMPPQSTSHDYRKMME